MKVTKEQLKRIIREAVDRKLQRLDEGPETVDMGETLDAVAGAIEHQLIEHLESEVTFSNVGEMTMGTIQSEDDLVLPGRYEDTDHWAAKIADQVCNDIRADVQKFAKEMLESLMSNMGY